LLKQGFAARRRCHAQLGHRTIASARFSKALRLLLSFHSQSTLKLELGLLVIFIVAIIP